ncbi:MAG: hypothetical protein HQK51_20490 [Oligoflexia bacterium]|nr:hypothetical protein [Oligoflexia bacterium]
MKDRKAILSLLCLSILSNSLNVHSSEMSLAEMEKYFRDLKKKKTLLDAYKTESKHESEYDYYLKTENNSLKLDLKYLPVMIDEETIKKMKQKLENVFKKVEITYDGKRTSFSDFQKQIASDRYEDIISKTSFNGKPLGLYVSSKDILEMPYGSILDGSEGIGIGKKGNLKDSVVGPTNPGDPTKEGMDDIQPNKSGDTKKIGFRDRFNPYVDPMRDDPDSSTLDDGETIKPPTTDNNGEDGGLGGSITGGIKDFDGIDISGSNGPRRPIRFGYNLEGCPYSSRNC